MAGCNYFEDCGHAYEIGSDCFQEADFGGGFEAGSAETGVDTFVNENAVALGFCAAFGTLMPPIFKGTFDAVLQTNAGHVVLAGVAVCLCGIVGSGLAGISKERELSAEKKKETIAEFNRSTEITR